MSSPSVQAVHDALSGCVLPYLECDPATAHAIKQVTTDGQVIQLQLEFGFPVAGCIEEIRSTITQHLKTQGFQNVDCQITSNVVSHVVQPNLQVLSNVKNIIAIASGKGGVGKSTVSANIAYALKQDGANVGILDADIYGPSQPRLLGSRSEQPEAGATDTTKPVIAQGIQSMSIGYLVDVNDPVIWRGPMVTSALDQLLRKTEWKDLDYLIIDLPPGTGDVHLTLCQRIPISGSVIVTTPQMISYEDALKSLHMLEKVHIPVLGIIENMSGHTCSHCGNEEMLFGEGGGKQLAQTCQKKFLGAIPLNSHIRQSSDDGVLVSNKDTAPFVQVARSATAQLSLLSADSASRIPNIVVDNS